MLLSRRRSVTQIADWRTLVLWSEIFPQHDVTKDDLVEQVRRVGKYRGLRLLTAIETIAFCEGSAAAATQIALVNDFAKDLRLIHGPIVAEAKKGRIIFAPEPLAILASLIIQHGADSEPDEARVMDGFMNAILMVNELFGAEQMDIQRSVFALRPGSDPVESFLPIELRAAALDDEPFDHLVARIHAFVKWARRQAIDQQNHLDIDAAFIEMFRHPYENLTAAGLIVRHYFRSIDSVPQLHNLNPILSVDFLVAPLRVQQPVRDFVRAHSIPIEELAPILAGRDRMTVAALLPLQRHPLIALGYGQFACPNLTFLSASLGIGLFHRLAEYYGAQGRRTKFYHFFARFLQDYNRRYGTPRRK